MPLFAWMLIAVGSVLTFHQVDKPSKSQAVFMPPIQLATSKINCPKGSYEYNGGCEMDIQPEIAPAVQPSDEKVPEEKLPSYEREGIKIINAPSMTAQDEKADQQKRDADAEGKKAAGLE